MKRIFILGLVAICMSTIGCSDFLKEESYGSTTDIFGEENGIKALVYQSYTKINNLRLLWFGCNKRKCVLVVEPLL